MIEKIKIYLDASPKAILPIIVTIGLSFLPLIFVWIGDLMRNSGGQPLVKAFRSGDSIEIMLPILASICFTLYDLSISNEKFRSVFDQYIVIISLIFVIISSVVVTYLPMKSEEVNLTWVSIVLLIWAIFILFLSKIRELTIEDIPSVRNQSAQIMQNVIEND